MELLQHFNIYPAHPGVSTGENEWFANPNQEFISSFNPTTGEELCKIHSAHESHYEILIEKAHAGFLKWRELPAPERGLIIREIAEELRVHKTQLGSLVSLEMGKSIQEGLGEVQEMIDIADFAVGQSRMLYGKTMPSERKQHRLMEQWHPLGIIGVISAFNFPIAVWSWNAFIAAVCGNSVIWKPSSKTPLCAIAVQQLCNKVFARHQLSGIFNLWISENRALSEKLLDDERIPLISFTGSTHTGKKVSERVAKRLGKTILELGGNNAVIIDETADLSLAIPAILFGAIGTAGQRCTSIRRLIIHESIYDTVINKLTHAYQQIRIGDPLDMHNLMGPLVDQSAVDAYVNAINQAKAHGGEIIIGGNVLQRPGFFIEPCLMRAENHWPIVQSETFAPIIYVMTYRDFSEAITLQNSVKQGLSSAIFSTNLCHVEQFLSAIGSDCGLANVNMGTSGAEIGGAFGGEKETGGGREAGSDCWKAYMRRQTNAINWGSTLPLAQGIKFDLTE